MRATSAHRLERLLVLVAVACAAHACTDSASTESGQPSRSDQGATAQLPCPADLCGDIEFSEADVDLGAAATFGASWGDFDRDGDPDLYVSNHAASSPSLYRNNGDGTFVDIFPSVTPSDAMLDARDVHAAAWADFDNNDTQDLLLQVGANSGEGQGPNRLFVNRVGVFSEESVTRGLDAPLGRGRTPLWVDWDGDGRLDAILSNGERDDGSSPTTVFLQRDNGNFEPDPTQPRAWAVGGEYASVVHLADEILPSILVDLARESFTDTLFLPGTTEARELEALAIRTPQDRVFADFDGDLMNDVVVTRHPVVRSDLVQTSSTSIAASMLMSVANPIRQGASFRASGRVTMRVGGIDSGEIYIGANGEHPPSNPDNRWNLDLLDSFGISEPSDGDGGLYVGFDALTRTWQFFVHSDAVWRHVLVEIESEGPISAIENHDIVDAREIQNAALFLWDDASGAFVDATATSGLQAGSACQSVIAEDFDNDTDLDLYMACASGVVNEENAFFENVGGGRFELIPSAAGAGGGSAGLADVVASADYDLDGRMDLVVTNGWGGSPFHDGVNRLYRNRTENGNHWIEIDLIGTESNRDGIGARVELSAGGVDQVRTRSGGMHRYAQNFGRLHFGLGSSAAIDAVVVHWPSGRVQRLTDVAADQLLTIVEGP